jgi:putative nucleotidyltransferase with HDIG domain
VSDPADPAATVEVAPPPSARRDAVGRVLGLALVALVSAASGWLLAPADGARLPGPDALGQPASRTIRADKDYDIEDQEATDRRREEDAEAVQPVYDHDLGAPTEAKFRIAAAFKLMRDQEQALYSSAWGGTSVRPAEVARRWADQRGAFASLLQIRVSDEDFAALVQARFGASVQSALEALAVTGLSGQVVEDRRLLGTDLAHGFVVREFLSGGIEAKRIVSGDVVVRDVASAREDVARAGAALPDPAPLEAALVRLASAMVRPTMVPAQVETARRRDEARASVKPVVMAVKRGERIIEQGEVIEKRHVVLFEGMRSQQYGRDLTHVRAGGATLVALLVSVLWVFARRNVPRFKPARRDALLLTALLVGTLALASAGFTVADALHEHLPEGLPSSALRYLIPVAAGAMIVRQVLSAEVALLFGLAAGLAGGLLAGQSIGQALFATLTSVAAAGLTPGSRDRAGLFRTGFLVGLIGAGSVVALGLFAGRPWIELGLSAVAAFAGGAIALPVVVVGFLPVVEGVFGYVTDVKLLELANLNHPALKELILQAPGTYHHSILMGSMVEAGAQAIGANPLLARVSAYYHDLGKTRNPLYFAENQRGENRHDALAPSMSALIVKRHVTDGLELARRWRLPRAVREAIAQHHGTRHVGYFWAKARRAAEDPVTRGAVLDEALFRYPGPRPQTREAALVMIADTCEASSRALETPNAEALRGLVHKRITELFVEGQFDECELTLKDLNAISVAMVRALEAIYHTRPGYPRPLQEAAGPPSLQLLVKP